jgi:hypothetical protein
MHLRELFLLSLSLSLSHTHTTHTHTHRHRHTVLRLHDIDLRVEKLIIISIRQ